MIFAGKKREHFFSEHSYNREFTLYRNINREYSGENTGALWNGGDLINHILVIRASGVTC